MAQFDDVILPLNVIAQSDVATAIHDSTTQFSLPNGSRKSIARYDEKLGVLTVSFVEEIDDPDLIDLTNIWRLVGTRDSFLARDWSDWNSTDDNTPALPPALEEDRIAQTDQPCRNTATGLFVGDSATTTFQLGKNTAVGAQSLFKRVRKPKSATLLVEVNSVLQTGGGVNYTLGATGVLTFNVAPTTGHTVNAGFIYDLPVYFPENQGFSIGLPFANARQVLGLTLMEELLVDP